MTDVAQVPGVTAITYHAWNADRSQLAISPNTNEVWIFAAKGDDSSKVRRAHSRSDRSCSHLRWIHPCGIVVSQCIGVCQADARFCCCCWLLGWQWEKKYTLEEHAGQVSGIDWCPTTNLIVTCGHDRNAYVWKVSKAGRGEEKRKGRARCCRLSERSRAVLLCFCSWTRLRTSGSRRL